MAFLQLIRSKDKKINEKITSTITINYISFLLSIWERKNLNQSNKDEIKRFWFNNFTPFNDSFSTWFFKRSIPNAVEPSDSRFDSVMKQYDNVYTKFRDEKLYLCNREILMHHIYTC